LSDTAHDNGSPSGSEVSDAAALAGREPPPGASKDEIAEWFANTDLADVDLEPVVEPGEALMPSSRKLETVAVRLPGWEIEELKRRAERLGIGYTTYVRMLVNRHVLDEDPIR
jgi:predicted DNA binding CopG/RHH family protein